MTVEVRNLQNFIRVPEKKLRTVLEHVMHEELGHEVNVSVAVVTDKRMAELNEAFLSHVGPTDVLAFPFGEKERGGEGEEVFGEIVISAQRAQHEAAKRNIDVELELILYAVHGMLHLTGYDDQTATQEKKMRRREAEILKGLAPRLRSKKRP